MGNYWCALAGVLLLFAPGWTVKLAGLCLIAYAADVGDWPTTLIVCTVGAVFAIGFQAWVNWAYSAQTPSSPKAPQGEGEPEVSSG